MSVLSLLYLRELRLREGRELVHSHSSRRVGRSVGASCGGVTGTGLEPAGFGSQLGHFPFGPLCARHMVPCEPDSLSSHKTRVAMTAFLTDDGEGIIKEVKVPSM